MMEKQLAEFASSHGRPNERYNKAVPLHVPCAWCGEDAYVGTCLLMENKIRARLCERCGVIAETIYEAAARGGCNADELHDVRLVLIEHQDQLEERLGNLYPDNPTWNPVTSRDSLGAVVALMATQLLGTTLGKVVNGLLDMKEVE